MATIMTLNDLGSVGPLVDRGRTLPFRADLEGPFVLSPCNLSQLLGRGQSEQLVLFLLLRRGGLHVDGSKFMLTTSGIKMYPE